MPTRDEILQQLNLYRDPMPDEFAEPGEYVATHGPYLSRATSANQSFIQVLMTDDEACRFLDLIYENLD
jgi:hypothetical protein